MRAQAPFHAGSAAERIAKTFRRCKRATASSGPAACCPAPMPPPRPAHRPTPPAPPRSRNCCKRRFGWLLEHTEPQTACLFDDQGQPAVDFLGRVEHLDEDMQVGCGVGWWIGGGLCGSCRAPLRRALVRLARAARGPHSGCPCCLPAHVHALRRAAAWIWLGVGAARARAGPRPPPGPPLCAPLPSPIVAGTLLVCPCRAGAGAAGEQPAGARGGAAAGGRAAALPAGAAGHD